MINLVTMQVIIQRMNKVKVTLLFTLSNYSHGIKILLVIKQYIHIQYIQYHCQGNTHTHIILLALWPQLVLLRAVSFVGQTAWLGREWASLQLVAWGMRGMDLSQLESREGSRQLLQSLATCTN